MPRPGNRVIWITAAEPVYFTVNNIQRTEYAPGQAYEVPAHAADGMIARGWARLATDSDLAPTAAEPPEQETAATAPDAVVEGRGPRERDPGGRFQSKRR